MTLCIDGARCWPASPAVDAGALGRKGQETGTAAWVLDAELEESLDPALEDAAEPEDSEVLEAAALLSEEPEDSADSEDSELSELLERDEVELFELAESVE